MKLFVAAALASFATPVVVLATQTYSLVYDLMFDDNTRTLASVACSFGPYGLCTKNMNVIGDVPSYPCLGGAPNIVNGFQSPGCGSCWKLTYGSDTNFVYFTAISFSPPGQFTVSLACLDSLTNGNSLEDDGYFSVTATEVSSNLCD